MNNKLQLVSTADVEDQPEGKKNSEKRLTFETPYFATKVSSKLHQSVVETFKIDAQTDFGRFSLRLLDYLLFPSFMNQDDESTGYVILSCKKVAELAAKPYNRSFNALKMLVLFSESVIPLDIKEHRYTEGRARCVSSQWPEGILLARETELERMRELWQPQKRAEVRVGTGTRVYMDTGKKVTVRSCREENRRYQDLANGRKEFSPPSDHPAYQLVKLLNNQSQKAIRSIFNQNLDALLEAAWDMPVSTPREDDQKIRSLSLISRLIDHSQIYYKTSKKTVRVSAVDTNIHLLPRELRKIALTGCSSLDLKSAQLALAARYWEIPALTDFLENALSSNASDNTSYWNDILTHLKLSPGSKGAVKTATYAMLFGRTERRLVSCLTEELQRDRSLTADQALKAAKGFLTYPLVDAILQARTKKMNEVISQGGLNDAFGKFIPAANKKQARSAMALQLQSYELKLVSAVLPILESEQRLHVCSWLHDGLTVFCADPHEAPRQLKRLEQAIVEEAALMQVYTKLEIELVVQFMGDRSVGQV